VPSSTVPSSSLLAWVSSYKPLRDSLTSKVMIRWSVVGLQDS